MTDIPVMQFYPDAYLADTMHLSLEEHGAYSRLLFFMWRAGGELPDDDTRLARMVGVSTTKWKKIRPGIDEFFIKNEGKITQKRLNIDYEKALEKREKLSHNGYKGGKAKSLKNNDTGLANATILPDDLPEQNDSKPPGKNVASRAETQNQNQLSSLQSDNIKQNTNARAPAQADEIRLEDLTMENISDWLMQQEVSGKPIKVDIRQELEKFKCHFLAYGGKDKNGNAVKNWVAKFGSWLLEANKQAKYGGQNEKTGRTLTGYQAGSGQRDNLDPASRAKLIGEQIIAKRKAAREAESSMGSGADQGQLGSSGQPDAVALPGLQPPENLR